MWDDAGVGILLYLINTTRHLVWRRPVTSLSAAAEQARVRVDHRILTLEEEGA